MTDGRTDGQLKHANFNRYILSLSFCPSAVGGESVERRRESLAMRARINSSCPPLSLRLFVRSHLPFTNPKLEITIMARARAPAPRTRSGERVFGLTLQNRSLLICRSLVGRLDGRRGSILLYFREPCIEQTLSSSLSLLNSSQTLHVKSCPASGFSVHFALVS